MFGVAYRVWRTVDRKSCCSTRRWVLPVFRVHCPAPAEAASKWMHSKSKRRIWETTSERFDAWPHTWTVEWWSSSWWRIQTKKTSISFKVCISILISNKHKISFLIFICQKGPFRREHVPIDANDAEMQNGGCATNHVQPKPNIANEIACWDFAKSHFSSNVKLVLYDDVNT